MRQDRRLWLQPGESVSKVSWDNQEPYEKTFERFARRPQHVPLSEIIFRSLVVGQEITLTTLCLASYRIATSFDHNTTGSFSKDTEKLQQSFLLVWVAFFVVILHNKPLDQDLSEARKVKIRHRTADGLFMAVLLRFLAAVLKTLTASYSTDTVHTLATVGFLLHLFACDYSYANGKETKPPLDVTKRPTFEGGTLSLTAAFFATILLASRLEENLTVYIFISSSVVLFAIYPAARNQVASNTKANKRWVPVVISFILALAASRLLAEQEALGLLLIWCVVCVAVPLWKFQLQKQKVTLVGPWVLVHPTMDAANTKQLDLAVLFPNKS